MKLLSKKQVENKKKKQQDKLVMRGAKIAALVDERVVKLNTVNQRIEDEKHRMSRELLAFQQQTDEERHSIIDEIAQLQEERAEAMKPIDAL